jgi:hypothetical protein
MKAPGQRRTISAASAGGQGAEVAVFRRNEERSRASKSGWAKTRRYCTGASMAWVARSRSAVARNRPGSKRPRITTRAPKAIPMKMLMMVALE